MPRTSRVRTSEVDMESLGPAIGTAGKARQGEVYSAGPWIHGYPPDDYYEGMENDFEVYFSPGGWIWHRRIAVDNPPET